MKIRISKFYAGILVLLLITPLVSAFGISSMFHKNNPLFMVPGETKEFSLGLQNMVGGEDLLFKVEIVSGGDIAVITDLSTEYLVPFRNSNTPVNLKVTIPEDAPLGQKKSIKVSVNVIPSKDGEMLQMNTGLVKSIPLIIGTESSIITGETVSEFTEEGFSTVVILMILLGAVILVIAAIVLRKKFKR